MLLEVSGWKGKEGLGLAGDGVATSSYKRLHNLLGCPTNVSCLSICRNGTKEEKLVSYRVSSQSNSDRDEINYHVPCPESEFVNDLLNLSFAQCPHGKHRT